LDDDQSVELFVKLENSEDAKKLMEKVSTDMIELGEFIFWLEEEIDKFEGRVILHPFLCQNLANLYFSFNDFKMTIEQFSRNCIRKEENLLGFKKEDSAEYFDGEEE
jgi:hypothetical protein